MTTPPVKKIIDLRGYDPTTSDGLKLTPMVQPMRMSLIPPTHQDYETAEFELRTVYSSNAPGIEPGDVVLFSRVYEAPNLKPIDP
jgi:hypothetical protein